MTATLQPKRYKAAAAAILATQQGAHGILSSLHHSLAAGVDSEDPIEKYAGRSVRDFEEAKEIQDRLAAHGRGTPFPWGDGREKATQSYDDEIRSNTAFLATYRERLQAKGSFAADSNAGGYEWVDNANELPGTDSRASSQLWVDPGKDGTEAIRYENGEEALRSAVLCEWTDILASKVVPTDRTRVGDLPVGDIDPFAMAMGAVPSPLSPVVEYASGTIESLQRQVSWLVANARSDEYLRRMYKPADDYRRDEWVSNEVENAFRAWASSDMNKRSLEGWKKRIVERLSCAYIDTVHILADRLATLVFRQRNNTFLNVILEHAEAPRTSTPSAERSFRISGHYYTWPLQKLAKFRET